MSSILDKTAETIRNDIEFLLRFIPATDPKQVERGLAPMFYITGTYEGDVELATKVKEICDRYGIELRNDEEEDYEEGVEQ